MIEHLQYDINYANRGENCGIYARPYDWTGEDVVLKSKCHIMCNQFVVDNFEKVSEI
jgi:hypothetical protein